MTVEKDIFQVIRFVESVDPVDEDRITKYFEGAWKTENQNGVWKLVKPNITQVEDPDWDWFFE